MTTLRIGVITAALLSAGLAAQGDRAEFATVSIAKQKPAFPQILVVRVYAASDVTVSVRPRTCLDVDAFSNQAERRPALEGFD